jgi:hypothetical protein
VAESSVPEIIFAVRFVAMGWGSLRGDVVEVARCGQRGILAAGGEGSKTGVA